MAVVLRTRMKNVERAHQSIIILQSILCIFVVDVVAARPRRRLHSCERIKTTKIPDKNGIVYVCVLCFFLQSIFLLLTIFALSYFPIILLTLHIVVVVAVQLNQTRKHSRKKVFSLSPAASAITHIYQLGEWLESVYVQCALCNVNTMVH